MEVSMVNNPWMIGEIEQRGVVMTVFIVIEQLGKIMGILKEILLNFNSFQTQQFFRFNGDYEYTNVLGGVFTLMIRMLLLALLIYKLMGVFSYKTVNTTVTTRYQINQVNTTLSPMDTNSPFLIAIEVVQTTNTLNETAFKNNTVAWSINASNIYTLLEPCTERHWQAAPPGSYEELLSSVAKGALLFCLPPKFEHHISIAQNTTIEIDFALRCRANCSDVNYTKVLVRPIILNWLINSQQSDNYLISFLDKRRYYGIDTLNYAFDTALSYQIAKYHIQTDSSLFPFQKISRKDGFLIPSQPGLSYYPNRFTNNIFVRMTFQLSNQQFQHKRSFIKIFDAISQIGGLIPIFMILFIWLNYYAMSHFEMTFIKRLHSDQKAKQYGVFYFLSKFFYSLLKLFNIDMNKWEKTQDFHKMHKTVNRLIDILYLYNRIEFLERALEVILDEHQIKALHLMRNKTFAQAEMQLENYQMKNNLQRFIRKRKKQTGKKTSSCPSEPQVNRQIFLEPNPTESQNQVDAAQTQKALVQQPQFQGEVREKQMWRPKLYPISMEKDNNQKRSDKMEPGQEEDSEYNEQVEQHQMNQLREAFACYQRLRRESHDSNSLYYNCISKNILKKLDNNDKELLDNLENLLEGSVKKEIEHNVKKSLISLINSEQITIQESLYRKNSRKSINDMQSKDGLLINRQHITNSLQNRSNRFKVPRTQTYQDLQLDERNDEQD